jgi:hypothetical protein
VNNHHHNNNHAINGTDDGQTTSRDNVTVKDCEMKDLTRKNGELTLKNDSEFTTEKGTSLQLTTSTKQETTTSSNNMNNNNNNNNPGGRRRSRRTSTTTTMWDPSSTCTASSATTTSSSSSSSRVKYDMEDVPVVEKSTTFWNTIETWPPRIERPLRRRANERINKENEATMNAVTKKETTTDATELVPSSAASSSAPSTFSNSFFPNSVLFLPTERQDWEDSISELVALCTSAAYRQYQAEAARAAGTKKIFYPPLSKEYIKDRIDIDDPLHGYQIRHKTGGWLQGFLLWTNFTTWTNGFEWNSVHPASGLLSTQYAVDDGTLANELQALPRHGNIRGEGLVFDHVAEVALLGGLGCGEVLLRTAIESIRRSTEKYKYLVLQATEGSRAFYERFGFVRVGAICQYECYDSPVTGGETAAAAASKQQQQQPPTNSNSIPLQGYCHWTHHNESRHSLDLHGGPSYMMCLKLPSEDSGIPYGNLLQTMKQYVVDQKPKIRPLGVALSAQPSPTQKSKVRQQVPNPTRLGMPNFDTMRKPKGTGTGRPRGRPRKRPIGDDNAATTATTTAAASSSSIMPDKKRRKVSEDMWDSSSFTPTSTAISKKPAATKAATATSKDRQQQRAASSSRSKSTTPKSNTTIKKQHSSITNKKKSPPPAAKSTFTPLSSSSSSSPPSPSSPQIQACEYFAMHPTIYQKKAIPVNSKALCKQKVRSYPRDRPHFYNKVVKLATKGGGIGGSSSKNKKSKTDCVYYFVLDFDDVKEELTLIPMGITGTLSGKRAGRPRYQCIVGDTNSNWKIGVSTSDYVIVPGAFMVMKTPLIAQEAWDITDNQK